jgi:protein CpxP
LLNKWISQVDTYDPLFSAAHREGWRGVSAKTALHTNGYKILTSWNTFGTAVALMKSQTDIANHQCRISQEDGSKIEFNSRRMKMKKVTLAVMAILFVAAIATSAFAFGWGRGPGYGPCARGDFQGQDALNLTAEQAAKIKEMRETHWKETKSIQEKTFTKRDEIRKLWLEPNPDQAKITEAQKEMRSFRDQMEDKMTAFHLETLKVLTPEQRAKITSSGPGRGSGHGRSSGPMHGFCPGGSGGAGCFSDCPGFGGRKMMHSK